MPLSRTALWAILEGAKPVVEPLLVAAYEAELEAEWRGGDHSPHGQPWHTSLHASQFPGDSDDICGRKTVYELLDPPSPEPRKPFLQAMFDLGLNLEHDWVRRFASYGALVSADVTGDDDYQTGFVDEEHWLTGSCDAIVLPRGWKKSHVCEIKTTSHEKILAMKSQTPTYPFSHGKYLRQLKTYICLAHDLPYTPAVNLCDDSGAIISPRTDRICPDHHKRCAHHVEILLPPDDGTLIYSSREEPLNTVSFHVQYDPAFFAAGLEQLAQWRDYFLRGEIPPHPAQGRSKKWTSKWCDRCEIKGKICKIDYNNNAKTFSESVLEEYAQTIRPEYNLEQKQRAVLFRWGVEDSVEHLQGQASSASLGVG